MPQIKYIFVTIAEEFGFIGSVFLIGVYSYLAYLGIMNGIESYISGLTECLIHAISNSRVNEIEAAFREIKHTFLGNTSDSVFYIYIISNIVNQFFKI